MSAYIKKSKLVLKSDIFYIVTFFLISLFALTWFHGEQYILAGDLGWPLNFARFFELTRSIWDNSVAPGYSAPRQLASFFPFATYGYIARRMGIGSHIFQRFIYVISFFLSGYGFYLLAREFKLTKLASGLSGLLYMLSPYALIVAWNPAYATTFPFYAFLPLCLAFFYKYLKSERLWGKELVVGLFVTFFSFIGASYSNPTFFILYLVSLGSIYLYVIWEGSWEHFNHITRKAALFVCFTLLLNMFWLISFALEPNFASYDNTAIGLAGDVATQYINSVSTKDALRMTGLWTMFAGQRGSNYYTFNELWRSSLYSIFSYIPVILAVLVVLVAKNKKLSLLLALFLTGVALNSGLRSPSFFENFIEPLYQLPFISRAFRSVYLKIGFLLVLYLSLLVGFSVDNIKVSRNIRCISLGIFTFTLFLVSYPFFTGEILRDHTDTFPGYSISIPDDHIEVANIINGDPESGKAFIFPIPEGYNYYLMWEEGGYVGSEFLRSLLDSPVYYVGSRPRMKEFSQMYSLNILKELGVKYIIYRKDIPEGTLKDYLTTNEVLFTQNVLNSPDVNKVLETQNLVLYQIEKGKHLPLFFTTAKEAKDLKVESSGFSKYVIRNIEVVKGTSLVFTEAYSDLWKARLHAGGKIYDLSSGHQLVFKYANSWDFPETIEDPKAFVELEFIGQKYFEIGLAITMVTMGVVVLIYLKEYLHVFE